MFLFCNPAAASTDLYKGEPGMYGYTINLWHLRILTFKVSTM